MTQNNFVRKRYNDQQRLTKANRVREVLQYGPVETLLGHDPFDLTPVRHEQVNRRPSGLTGGQVTQEFVALVAVAHEAALGVRAVLAAAAFMSALVDVCKCMRKK